MRKRVFCLLLAAALLSCCALAQDDAAEPVRHGIITSCDSRFGSVKLDSALAAAEDNVYFHVTPREGFVPQNPKISTASGLAVQCFAAGSEGGVFDFYFLMPDDDVTVSISFDFADAPFDDVAVSDWFSAEVMRAYNEGLMSGTGERCFAPFASTDRAMLVTILWRLSGSPEAASQPAFSDVDASAWYAPAVAWAAENAIVTGFEDGSFHPAEALTREQFAAILYRYAGFSGLDTGSAGSLDKFSDASSLSGWALDAMRWAVGCGVITGSGPALLSPQGSASRAQTAVMLVRFLDLQ